MSIFPVFYRTRKVHCRVLKSPPPVPVLSYMNSIHTPQPISQDEFFHDFLIAAVVAWCRGTQFESHALLSRLPRDIDRSSILALACAILRFPFSPSLRESRYLSLALLQRPCVQLSLTIYSNYAKQSPVSYVTSSLTVWTLGQWFSTFRCLRHKWDTRLDAE